MGKISNQVEEEKTFIFNNVRLKKNSTSNDIYLNTAQGDKTTITPTEPFEIPLAIPVNIYECNTPTKREILAVEKLTYYSCVKCFEKVVLTPDSNSQM